MPAPQYEGRIDERVMPAGVASGGASAAPARDREYDHFSQADGPVATAFESQLDLDVTVLAFAQWVSEMKVRQHNSQHQMQAELSMIRNAVTANHADLSDFKRHGAAIQQQMQSEINEIRESLSNVFMEITAAVRNNAAADQDIKLKIQSLNEQAVRNETAFAQLADAADQSQSKLRSAVTEMQMASERMRDELSTLNRHTDNLETAVGERAERIQTDMDQLTQELHMQLERRKEHLKKMVNDVVLIGESLQNLVADFGEQRKGASETQSKLQASLYLLDQTLRKDSSCPGMRAAPQSAPSLLEPGARFAQHPPQPQPQQVSGRPAPTAMMGQVHIHSRPMPMQNMVYR